VCGKVGGGEVWKREWVIVCKKGQEVLPEYPALVIVVTIVE
jgi:hypothetical protein